MSIKIRHGSDVYHDGVFIGRVVEQSDGRWHAVTDQVLGVFTDRLGALRCLVNPPAVDDAPIGDITTWRRRDGRPLFVEPGLRRAA